MFIIKELDVQTADDFLFFRKKFLEEHHDGEEAPLLWKNRTHDLIIRMLKEKQLAGVLLYDKEICIGSAAFYIHKQLPLFHQATRITGKVINVYILPDYRKRGGGRLLMEALMEKAVPMNLDRLELMASEKGFPLYEKLGFRLAENEPFMYKNL